MVTLTVKQVSFLTENLQPPIIAVLLMTVYCLSVLEHPTPEAQAHLAIAHLGPEPFGPEPVCARSLLAPRLLGVAWLAPGAFGPWIALGLDRWGPSPL